MLKDGKIFFTEYIIHEYWYTDGGPPLRDRFFKRIPSWESAPDIQNKIWIRIHGNQYSFYKEIHPFLLSRDPCGSWLRWDSLPNPGREAVKALTPIDPNCFPFGHLPRGIGYYIDPKNLSDLLSEYSLKLQNLPGGVIPMQDFETLSASLMGHSVSQSEEPSSFFSSMVI